MTCQKKQSEAEIAATDAWDAYCAIRLTERAKPELRHSPAWTIIRQTAYETFALAMERLNHG